MPTVAEAPFDKYLQLPPEKYALLDPKFVTRESPTTFRFTVPLKEVMSGSGVYGGGKKRGGKGKGSGKGGGEGGVGSGDRKGGANYGGPSALLRGLTPSIVFTTSVDTARQSVTLCGAGAALGNDELDRRFHLTIDTTLGWEAVFEPVRPPPGEVPGGEGASSAAAGGGGSGEAGVGGSAGAEEGAGRGTDNSERRRRRVSDRGEVRQGVVVMDDDGTDAGDTRTTKTSTGDDERMKGSGGEVFAAEYVDVAAPVAPGINKDDDTDGGWRWRAPRGPRGMEVRVESPPQWALRASTNLSMRVQVDP